jgi:phosphoribosylformylglycinamidine synthase
MSIKGRTDAALFGEAASRIVISVAPGRAGELETMLHENETPFARLGFTGSDRLRLADAIDVALQDLRGAYEGGLEAALGQA